MIKYPKIHSPFMRGPDKKFLDEYAKMEYGWLSHAFWEWTEKIDGMNIRVWVEDDHVCIGGRTDRAQLPSPLWRKLDFIFNESIGAYTLKDIFETDNFCLFGEGYGSGIQKGGGNYSSSQDFILFDIWVNGVWLSRLAIDSIASQLQLRSVKHYGNYFLGDVISMFKHDKLYRRAIDVFTSGFPNVKRPEGIIGVPVGGFLSRTGDRIITKVKFKDFPDSQ